MAVAIAGAIAGVLSGAAPARAQGGPPLITDDPDTPGPGYWEVNVSALLDRSAQSARIEAPRLDVNLGVGRTTQLKLEAPWLRISDAGAPPQQGPGDVTAGVKWRFLGEEGKRIAWSIYPQANFDAFPASGANGLADPRPSLLLPTELTVEIHPIEVNAELGATIARGSPAEWVCGVSTEAEVSPRLELLAELHGNAQAGAAAQVIVNAGGRVRLTQQATLMVAVGRAIRGVPMDTPRVLVFAGLQLTLPGLYDFRRTAGASR